MEVLKSLEVIFKEPLFVFFLWTAVVYILASIFVDRKVSFWIALVSSSYLWYKNDNDISIIIKVWGIISGFLLIVYLSKTLFHLNIVLFFKGKKRCPMCCEEAFRKAKVCPHCGYRFVSEEDACKDV